MAQVDGYPIGTTLNEWTLTGAATAHEATDEVYPPGNTTDYASVGGFTGAKVLRLVMDPGPPDTFTLITSYTFTLNMSGLSAVNVPALRVRLYVAGGLRSGMIFGCNTGGAYDEVSFAFENLNIIAPTWESGPVELEFVPINGDSGYQLP